MLDLDVIEQKIHDEPAGPLTGIAIALVAEVRRLRAGLNDVRQMLIEAGAEEAARMVEEPVEPPKIISMNIK